MARARPEPRLAAPVCRPCAARRGEARRGEARRGEARRGEGRRDEGRRGEARRGEASRDGSASCARGARDALRVTRCAWRVLVCAVQPARRHTT
eukprot:3293417-Prymnesium_polylepis.1